MLYHKIHTLFKRTERGEMILGDWTNPVFEYLADKPWRMTEKIDGTNIRIIVEPPSLGVADGVTFGGRTERAQLPGPLVEYLTDKFLQPEMLEALGKKFPEGAVLFGEGYGAGIQKGGGKYRQDQGFILFDVNVGGWWLLPDDIQDVSVTLGLDMVPEIGTMTLVEGVEMVQKGMKSRFGSFDAEGVVATPAVPLFTRKGERVITKIKTKDWQRAVVK